MSVRLALAMTAVVVVERAVFALLRARRLRIEDRYSPLVRRALAGDDAALGLLVAAPRGTASPSRDCSSSRSLNNTTRNEAKQKKKKKKKKEKKKKKKKKKMPEAVLRFVGVRREPQRVVCGAGTPRWKRCIKAIPCSRCACRPRASAWPEPDARTLCHSQATCRLGAARSPDAHRTLPVTSSTPGDAGVCLIR